MDSSTSALPNPLTDTTVLRILGDYRSPDARPNALRNQLRICDSCRREIGAELRVCPLCGCYAGVSAGDADPPARPGRKSLLRRWSFWA